ncbi:hypothetical protein VL20_5450 [Microcystis panniformis FACHB-1757]|uniref:Uncharacterized protein n=1 Tax=Microcystis panniformis FACHB-1757 TaxID=1638788 RepID=A0A0K1S818_9CHRO|nr:hypothetical protein VL20_5450 [Microcystis panniformis FACHB-1757]
MPSKHLTLDKQKLSHKVEKSQSLSLEEQELLGKKLKDHPSW